MKNFLYIIVIFCSVVSAITAISIFNSGYTMNKGNVSYLNKITNDIGQSNSSQSTKNVSFLIQVLYYFKEENNSLCSGLKEGARVKTVRHCISNYDWSIDKERIMYDENVLTKNVILRTDLIINSNNNQELGIATADKGIIGAKSNGGCYNSECKFYQLEAYKIVGQGNSGSPVYDWDGEYAGTLSMVVDGKASFCDEIAYEHPLLGKVSDNNRLCSYDVLIATSEEFRIKVR